jgi:hypothetical protein
METRKKLNVVRCSAQKLNGESCMTLYPHEDPKHDGPCHYCAGNMSAEQLRKQTLKQLISFEPQKGNSWTRDYEAVKNLLKAKSTN